MTNSKGAMTLAEGRYDYRVDVSLILNNGKDKKSFVLRTCLESYSSWKAKYCKGCSPFESFNKGSVKMSAIVDNEVWVFGVDSTVSNDIVAAVQTGMNHFKVKAQDILGDVYVKNLNAECEKDMLAQTLVNANKKLYSSTCKAIIEAAKILGCSDALNFWVFSNSKNPKIKKKDLQESLTEGGAKSVVTDDETKHVFYVGDNFGGPGQRFKSNLHLASLRV